MFGVLTKSLSRSKPIEAANLVKSAISFVPVSLRRGVEVTDFVRGGDDLRSVLPKPVFSMFPKAPSSLSITGEGKMRSLSELPTNAVFETTAVPKKKTSPHRRGNRRHGGRMRQAFMVNGRLGKCSSCGNIKVIAKACGHCGFFHGRFFEEALTAVGKKRVRSLRIAKLISRNEASLSSPVHLLPNPSLLTTSPLRLTMEKRLEKHAKIVEKKLTKENKEKTPAKEEKSPNQ